MRIHELFDNIRGYEAVLNPGMEISKELELFTAGDMDALKEMRDQAFMDNDTILYFRCKSLIEALEIYEGGK